MDPSKLTEIRGKLESGAAEKITEASTKRILVEPVLSILGWDVTGLAEVKNEYRSFPSDNPVDYAIFLDSKPCFFLEAKALGVNIGDRKTVTQAVAYASVCGVEWAVITNGRDWAIYNTLVPADAEQKLFERFSIMEARSGKLLELLSKTSMCAGEIHKTWEERRTGLSITKRNPFGAVGEDSCLLDPPDRDFEKHLEKWNEWLLGIVNRSLTDGWNGVVLTEESRKIWETWSAHNPSSVNGEVGDNNCGAKWGKLVLRLSKMLHCLKCGGLATSTPVGGETLSKALEIAKWLVSEDGSDMWVAAPENFEVSKVERLLRGLYSFGLRGATVRDLRRNGYGESRNLELALRALESKGHIAVVKPDSKPAGRVGRRPWATRWVHKKYLNISPSSS